jgi:hypothetical protein
LALCACGAKATEGTVATRVDPLRWPPPNLVEPVRIDLGDGYTNTHLSPETNAEIVLPDRDKVGGVTIEGGHNIVLIGGEITVPAGSPPGAGNDRFRTGLYIKGATGTVHVEGVRFSGVPGAVWDAIDLAAPRATVQLENLRVDGVRGGFHGFHADVVQPWGGVANLRINRLTASSNYQGLTIPMDLGRIGRAEVSRVNLRGLDRDVDEGGHLIWLTSGASTCAIYPVQIRGVYVMPRADLGFGHSVWPQVGRPQGCGAHVMRGAAVWPALADVRGRVHSGNPPNGYFVPRGVAGLDYVSPGYRRRG